MAETIVYKYTIVLSSVYQQSVRGQDRHDTHRHSMDPEVRYMAYGVVGELPFYVFRVRETMLRRCCAGAIW